MSEDVVARIEIARRFCGPPQSGNGGYVGGLLAETLEGEGAAAVRLFAPPALEQSLEIRATDDGRRALFDGGTKLAEARRIELDLEVPPAPDFAGAELAAKSFRGFDDLVFPKCFVCGFQRPAGDGLRIFPGAREDGVTGFAAPWIPDANLVAKGADHVAPEFLWAALDCPGSFAFPQPEGRIVLLGEMRAELVGRVSAGERCVLSSWYVERDGRKHFSGSAIFGEGGRFVGRAMGVWIELAPDAVPRS